MGQLCSRSAGGPSDDSAASAAEQQRARFLLNLPPDTQHHYPFRSDNDIATKARALREELVQGNSHQQYLVFEDAPLDSVYPLVQRQDPAVPRVCYDATLEIVVVRIDSLKRWRFFGRALGDLLAAQAARAGMAQALMPVGHAPHVFGSVIKEADCAWEARSAARDGPAPDEHGDATSTLTVVGEFGFPESAGRLDVDARRWIEDDGSTVQLAFFVTVHDSQPDMDIVVYERTRPQEHVRRASTATTSSLSSLSTSMSPSTAPSSTAAVRQRIRLRRQQGRTAVSADLVLPFDKVFLRPRNPSRPCEADLVVSRDELSRAADAVWQLPAHS